MKCVLAILVSVTALSAVDVHVAAATDITIITGDLAIAKSLVRCAAPDQCTVVMMNDVATGPTLGVITHDLPIALLDADQIPFDIVRDGVAALVGSTVGSGMAPSQSVKFASVLHTDPTASLGDFTNVGAAPLNACDDSLSSCDRNPESIGLSATIFPTGADSRNGNCACASDTVASIVNFEGMIPIGSLSVGRFGHRADFLQTADSISRVTEFPIDGRQPVNLGIRGIGRMVSYPRKSGDVTP